MNNSGIVEVLGLQSQALQKLAGLELELKEWQRLFPVFLSDSYPPELSQTLPILGTYTIENDFIFFTPRFSFRHGLAHYARFDLQYLYNLLGVDKVDQPEFWETTFFLKKLDFGAETTVTNIFPSADIVPANLLKVYIHFSAPMRFGNAHDYVRLLNSRDEEIKLPFVEVEQGLWDRSRKRLTLFFHPGRIKRGVAPNQQMGPVLKTCETYRLVIDRQWKDANGMPLKKGFQKTFKVVNDDRSSINHLDWRLTIPSLGSTEPLILEFPEALDHALLGRMIRIRVSSERLVAGKIGVFENETRWCFVPESPWMPGDYSIEINTALEDLAGNNLKEVFDREKGTTTSSELQNDIAKIHFQLKDKS